MLSLQIYKSRGAKLNKKVLYTLEYDKIITKLCEKATSEIGKRYAQNAKPLTDVERIRTELTRTADAYGRIVKFGSLSFAGLSDVRPFEKIEALKPNGHMLKTLPLKEIKEIIQNFFDVKK